MPVAEPAVQRGRTQLAQVSLAWRETSPPPGTPVLGPPVVALHGMSSSSLTWDRFAASAARAGRRVIALDLRGHGRSSRPGHYRSAAMRDDVLAFLAALRTEQTVEPVDLVGHSLGGHVAVLVAQHSPERVRRLVVEDVSPPPFAAGDAALRTRRQRAAFALHLLAMLPRAGLSRAPSFDIRMAPGVMRELLGTPDPGWWAALPGISAGTLLVSGGDASHVARSRIERMALAIPGCRLVTLAEAGHRVHSKQPEQFAGAVLPFLSGS